ncbi:MAG: hypothetical protein ACLTDR_07015 [Adlercreutzia equolifaciens]
MLNEWQRSRHHRPRRGQALHAPVQLPAVLHRARPDRMGAPKRREIGATARWPSAR